jgi:hypothetical protein
VNANAALFTGARRASPSRVFVHQPSKLLYCFVCLADLSKCLLQDFGVAERDAWGCRVGLRQAERGCEIMVIALSRSVSSCKAAKVASRNSMEGRGPGSSPDRSRTDLTQPRLRFGNQLRDFPPLGLIVNLRARP